MKAVTIISLIVAPFLIFSQESYNYSNPDFFKGEGIIFTDEYSPFINLPKNSQLFTPKEEDILKAEKILILRYNDDVNCTKRVKDVTKKYLKHNRQYLGYQDGEGTKFILVNLLNFKCKKKALVKFENWTESFFVGFGEYYEKNTIRLLVNLDAETLKFF